MTFSVRTLLFLTFIVALALILVPKYMAVLVFLLLCSPLTLLAFRFRKIREKIGRVGTTVFGVFAVLIAYVAFVGPWLMYTTYSGCATPFYGIPTPLCDSLQPLTYNVMIPLMEPATTALEYAIINDEYEQALGISAENFDPAGWYTCEWMRFGMLLLTDEPPF